MLNPLPACGEASIRTPRSRRDRAIAAPPPHFGRLNSTAPQAFNKRMRVLVENLIRIAIVLIAARAFFVEPISVETSSMAPHLLGVHGVAVCPKCDQEILWGTDLV